METCRNLPKIRFFGSSSILIEASPKIDILVVSYVWTLFSGSVTILDAGLIRYFV